MLCFFPFLENSEEGKGHHQSNRRNQKGGCRQQKIWNLGTDGIKFEPINLPVDRRWQRKELIKSRGMMVSGSNRIKYEGPGLSKAIISSHDCRYNYPWSGIATNWWSLLMVNIMWRPAPKAIKKLVAIPMIVKWQQWIINHLEDSVKIIPRQKKN